MASDEYRVEIDIHESVHGRLSERLRSLDLDDEVAERLGDRVIVTRDGEKLYVYTQTAAAAAEAERVVRDVARRGGHRGRAPPPPLEPRRALLAGRRRAACARRAETPPDPADTATNKDLPHPLFVYIEGHEPEFLRDLGL